MPRPEVGSVGWRPTSCAGAGDGSREVNLDAGRLWYAGCFGGDAALLTARRLWRRPFLSLEGLRLVRLLCITGIDPPSWDWRLGMPFRLGLMGALLPVLELLTLRRCEKTLGGSSIGSAGGEAAVAGAGCFEALGGDRLLLGEDSVDFWDDVLGGGLGGVGDSPFFFFFFSVD